MNETCNLTITHEKTTWENCCPISSSSNDPSPPTSTSSCPPILNTWDICPTPYTNCADPSSHKEMCSAELTGYTDSQNLNKKCCPGGYTCGSNYNTPCLLIHTNSSDSDKEVFTNPQYISKPAVFAGCNDASSLSPAAIGGIVAVGVITFCLLFGLVLWWIRRRLYRDPARRQYGRTEVAVEIPTTTTVRRRRGEQEVSGMGMGVSGGTGITITREFKVEEKKGDAEEGEELERMRGSVDSTTRIVPGDGTKAPGSSGSGSAESGGSRGPPPEGTLWVSGERRGGNEDATALMSERH
ncbi:hypothetical protein L873DRAFT_1843578 [Choiromyces venosus 120613-1]|uniref:Uncharacterized protein n=1 Tax=Choiromyces venosus 120613-1 TaxID=1336337 RepID=A0A3N4JMJ8_9PEZI|nr:hypothetical protein L873DRAFT_1843578 [Choiromyces venosus 120613-1]